MSLYVFRSCLRRYQDVAHENSVEPRLAESGDSLSGRADDRFAVVEGRIEHKRRAGALVKVRNERMVTRIGGAPHDLHARGAVLVNHRRNKLGPPGPGPTG